MTENLFFPICEKFVTDKCNSIFCNSCNSWVHQRCNLLSNSDFEKLTKSNDSDSWFCLHCNSNIFPFNKQHEPVLPPNLSTSNSHFLEYKSLFSDLNKLTHTLDEDLSTTCMYYEPGEFSSIKNKNKCLSAFHLNIASMNAHFDDLCTLLSQLNHNFGILAITETRINSSAPSLNFQLPNYSIEHTPTESSAGGVLLYISNRYSYKIRTDLSNICYKSKNLESVFIEINQPNKSNLIVGLIYRHPCMALDEFNNHFLSTLLDKTSNENKTMILLGDFNIDLLKCDDKPNHSKFLDILCSHALLPSILLPTRLTSSSKTLIDNIFISSSSYELTAGNIVSSISDHLPQFVLLNNAGSLSNNQPHIYRYDWSNFDRENLILDYLNIDWDELLKLQDGNINNSYNVFHTTFSELIDKHVPLKKLTRKQVKTLSKPWITPGIIKSIKLRDSLFKSFHKTTEPNLKSYYLSEYKRYRNTIVTLCRTSKSNYYTQYFTSNIDNIQKIWRV